VATHVLIKDVNDDITQIDQNPFFPSRSFDTNRLYTKVFLEQFQDTVGDGVDLPGVAAVTEHEPVTERGSAPHIQDGEFRGFHFNGGFSSCADDIIGIDGDVLLDCG